MKRRTLILSAIIGLVFVALLTAALTLDSVGFNRVNATSETKWLDSENILKYEDYDSTKQQLNYDLLHVMYDGLSVRFANTTFGQAESMGPWPTELDDSAWDAEITGQDFIQVMDLIPTIGKTDEVTELRAALLEKDSVKISEAASYIYALLHSCVINYAEISNLDQLGEYIGVILDKQYFNCQFLYMGDNSTSMVLNVVRAAILDRGQYTLSYSTETTDEGTVYRIEIGY